MTAPLAGDGHIWITGASSGIGRAMVGVLAASTARIVGVARSPEPDLTTRPEHLAWIQADLSEPAGWATVSASFDRTLAPSTGGSVTLIHAAATASPLATAAHADPVAYERAILLNAVAPAVLGQRFLRAARLAGSRARVLQVTTGTSTGIYPGWSVYRAGKAAVNEWVTTVGAEAPLAAHEPTFAVYAIAPGTVDTPMQGTVRNADPAGFPRVGKFEELARSGALRRPEDAARQLLALIDGELETGAVVDVRDL